MRVDEAMRYLGVPGSAGEDIHRRMTELSPALEERIRPRYVLRVLPVSRTEGTVSLDGGALPLPGRTARIMLADCAQAALLVCTLGAGFDAWMRTEQARNMPDAVMLDALGSAYVEEGCDAAERELSTRFPGMYLTDRFSPGYGDLPLTIQPAILTATDSARRLGVTATESCLLNPQKTVTAVIGIADRPQRARVRGCAHCAMRGNCDYRKRGEKACAV